MAPHDHNCRHLLGELSPYLEGEASAEICAEIARHLADCENCQAVVDTLRKTITLYHTLPQPELPDGARERLYRTLKLDDFLPPRA
ncbi:MAG: zf-HC2 domain-containing protein [Anaerolineales bacterium]|nr:zf-HC2 domain-containing protein [Anaerolineales bacterium]